MTYYSNYGSWVSVAAPGDFIYSTTPTYTASAGLSLDYDFLSGTSEAGPHVSGEAALIESQNPALTNAEVRNLITSNVDPYTPYYGPIAPNSGRINVYRALQSAGTGLPLAPASDNGYHDSVSSTSITGWGWDSARTTTTLNVDIYDGTTLLATVPANVFRQDLLNAHIGNGYHGFRYPTPASLKDGKAHTIYVKFAGTSTNLHNTPRSYP